MPSKKTHRTNTANAAKAAKAPARPADDDHIVFTNRPDGESRAPEKDQPPPAPRPDVKKIIGGASWTGKVPVQLLSEHCQREKWGKPDYSMRNVAGENDEPAFRSTVTISKTDPKTRETTRTPPISLPQSHEKLANQSTALEARHFAACYALFRVSSMKNIHMTLPPTYRDLWKGPFADLKKMDVAEGRAWKYDADPFAAEAKRKEIQASILKRQEEKVKQQEKAAAAAELNVVLPIGHTKHDRAFERAPRVELGDILRVQLETAVRVKTEWNSSNIQMNDKEEMAAETELTKIGFRQSHVREAMQNCGTRDEVLDFLLIHIPEDDLPRWALPKDYNASIRLASGDLVKEAKLKRLAEAGYSTELCAEALKDNDGSEALALEALQMSLVPPPDDTTASPESNDVNLWEEELLALESIMLESFSRGKDDSCVVTLHDLPTHNIQVTFQKPSEGYPIRAVPIIAIHAASVPAYVRLSAVRQAIRYAWITLLGDQMIFSLVEWLTAELPRIVADPGKLRDLKMHSASLRVSDVRSDIKQKQGYKATHAPRRGPQQDTRSDLAIKGAWESRQGSAAQQKMLQSRAKLPAWQKRFEIVQAIADSQVTLITGDTGSGKSTQSVQFVLDDAISNMKGSHTNIVCTQPRRVAALALSDRVSSERTSEEGDEIGYIIRGQSRISAKTKVTFMTTGVLLRRLQLSGTLPEALQGISHVFVDEVHERSLDTDFLLALLRDALRQVPRLKVILMSATVDADVFTRYFGGPSVVSRAHIDGRTFPVQDRYLDDVLRLTGKESGSWPEDDSEEVDVGKVIQSLGMGINYDLIASLVEEIDHQLGSNPGGILIFLPGTMEIDRCLRAVGKLPKLHALPLHASLTPNEQKKVFPPPPKGLRKVIAATNVAETSITIDDIVAVIDSGRVKETAYDATSNIVRLTEVWASQAACKQRRGRAGRVQAGTCYRLFTRNVEASMRPAAEPEMNRTPLEQLCLSVKATAPTQDAAGFLAKMLSPPSSGAINSALKTLHRVGALENGLLTGLGTYLSMIPADLRCAKLVILGTLFGCVEACLTIASILTVRSPFISPREKREEAKEARSRFSTSDGDLLLDHAAFDQWKDQQHSTTYRDLQRWCNDNFLSIQTLRDIDSTRHQLLDALKEAALIPNTYHSHHPPLPTHPNLNTHNTNSRLLRALITGSLNPNIAEIALPSKKYIASMTGAKELDPEARTIKYFGEPHHQAQTSPDAINSFTTPTTTTTTNNETTTRLFIHPSSTLFTTTHFTAGASYISYFSKIATSKTFIRELTPCNAYGILLFGGAIEVDTFGRGIVVDGWLRMRGWARVGVLVRRLRMLLDEELKRRIDKGGEGEGALDEELVGLVVRLVEFNGMDQ